MPASSSITRTVPGANVGPAGRDSSGAPDGSATAVASPDRPTTRASTSTLTTPSTARPMVHAVVVERPGVAGGAGAGGRETAGVGVLWAATPGPAEVVTSDHAAPL